MPYMPKKRLMGSMEPGLVEKRRVKLESYLRDLLKNNFWGEAMADFLNPDLDEPKFDKKSTSVQVFCGAIRH